MSLRASRAREVAERMAATIIDEARTERLRYDLAQQPGAGKYLAIITVLDGTPAATTGTFDRPEDVQGVIGLLINHAKQTEPVEVVDRPPGEVGADPSN